MNIFWTVMACVSIVAGCAATCMLIVLVLAGTPNSTPAQLRFLKIVVWSFAALGLICPVVAGIVLFQARPMIATLIAAVPVIASSVFLVLAVRNEW